MTRETYIRMTEPFRRDPRRAKALSACNRLLTGLVYLCYPLLLLLLFLREPEALTRAILVPLDGFIIVSVFRFLVNRRRPYEYFGIAPVIPKETKGKSFPSRHVFSAAIIAVTFCFQSGMLAAGLGLLAVALLIGGTRVLAGVHYISDVLAGIACGLIFGIIGFLV